MMETTMTAETAVATAEVKREFETETCSRCGGSGHYSYCQRYGTTCFKCAGRKRVLTKRGAAARAFFVASWPTKLPKDLSIGDRFYSSGVTNGGDVYGTVCEVTGEPSAPKDGGKYLDQKTGEWIQVYRIDFDAIELRTKQKVLQGFGQDSKVSLIPRGELRAMLLTAAFDYQDTLTQQGKPRKTKKGGK